MEVRARGTGETPAAPDLSIIVASRNARRTAVDAVRALRAQCEGKNVELLLVDNSTDGTGEALSDAAPEITVLRAPEEMQIPELWARGIRASRGTRVAITTAHCIPEPGFVSGILRALDGSCQAVGGAVENEPSAGTATWAVYFCRYSRYMLPFEAAVDADLPGDNAAYDRAAIDQFEELWKDGFWEPEVHRAMLQHEMRLCREPSIVVRHVYSFGVRSFLSNRFHHGREHGRTRARELSTRARLVRTAGAPLIPLVMAWRAAGSVFMRGRHRAKFILALPLIVLFYCAWALGEAAGHVAPVRSKAAGEDES